VGQQRVQTPSLFHLQKIGDSTNRVPGLADASITEELIMAVIDWDAVRRDYRTAKFTDIELSAKHNVTREAIGRRRRREPDLWVRDLSQAIKEATDAALVTSMVTDNHTRVTDTVLAMAEVNVQILRGQHKRVGELSELLTKGMAKARSELDDDESTAAVQTLSSITNTAKVLTELERKVFKLDDTPPDNQNTNRQGLSAVLTFEDVRKKVDALS